MNLIYIINGTVFGISFLFRCFWTPSFSALHLVQRDHQIAEIGERRVTVPLQPIRRPAGHFYVPWERTLEENVRYNQPPEANENGEEYIPVVESLHNTLQLFRQRLIGDQGPHLQIRNIEAAYVNWEGLAELSHYFLLREGFIQPQDLTQSPITTEFLVEWLNLDAIWGPMIPNRTNQPNQITSPVPEPIVDPNLHWNSELCTVFNVIRIPDNIQNQIGSAIRIRYYEQIFQTPVARAYVCIIVLNRISVFTFVVLFLWFLFTFISNWLQYRSQTYNLDQEL